MDQAGSRGNSRALRGLRLSACLEGGAMDGSRGGRQPLEVRREFAGSRLEEQIRVRVYELVLPVIRRSFTEQSRPATEPVARGSSSSLKKGA